MNFLPIFTRELRAELRNQRLQRGRVAAGALAAVALAVLVLVERKGGVPMTTIFSLSSFAQFGPLCLIAIGLGRAGNLLMTERREGTLQLLLLTKLNGHDIVRGKLLSAMVMDLNGFLACLPAMAIPWYASGTSLWEIVYLALGCLNILFFTTSLGLLGSIVTDSRHSVGFVALLLLPLALSNTPVGALIPYGVTKQIILALQWLNPAEPLAHMQTAAAGFRTAAYWQPLLTNHLTGWCFLLVAGMVLPRATRQLSGKKLWFWQRWLRRLRVTRRNVVWRSRLLDRNPFFWLTSRDPWPTIICWNWLIIPALAVAWLSWLVRDMPGVMCIFVILLGAIWHFVSISLISPEAGRQLLNDRLSGALEMLLSTPLTPTQIARGQWASLRRRYLPPLVLVFAGELTLMIAGYLTYGFGGMLDPEDRGRWLGIWAEAIVLLPITMYALIWGTMAHAMRARNVGEAGVLSMGKVLVAPGLVFWLVIVLIQFAGVRPAWWQTALSFGVFYSAIAISLAIRFRDRFLGDLRRVAAGAWEIIPKDGMDTQLVTWWNSLITRAAKVSSLRR